MKKSFKELIDKTDASSLGNLTENIREEKVSDDTLMRIKEKVMTESKENKVRNPFKRWIPAVSLAACFALVLGVVIFSGVLNKKDAPGIKPGTTETYENVTTEITASQTGTAVSSKEAKLNVQPDTEDKFSTETKLGEGSFGGMAMDRWIYSGIRFYESLGEFYSETALRNRLKSKIAYENKIARQIQEAQSTNAPNLVVLKTMRFYMISFSGGYMPIRKKNPSHILTWQNDAELDKLTALNAKINEGATLNSLRSDLAEKEEAVRRIEKTRDDCDGSDEETIMKLNASLLLAEKELREAADLLTTAEQVLGGTFLQTVAGEERNRKESKYVPNGTKPGGNAR